MSIHRISFSQLPKLYFQGGAGGSWLNYVTWCGLEHKTIDHNFANFHVNEVKKLIPNYSAFYQYIPHNATKEFANIRLGGKQALINFYINVRRKNPGWQGGHVGGYIRTSSNKVFEYNLEYTDIFLNPEAFLIQLKTLSGYDIRLDKHTEIAIEQYRRSCPWTELTFDELAKTDHVQEAWKYCLDHMTDADLPELARQDQAWNIVREHLLVLK